MPATLPPVRPAAPTRVTYEKRVYALIDEMADSLQYWLAAAYRADTPATTELTQDAAASTVLAAAFDKLQTRWLRKFDILSVSLSKWFAKTSRERVDRTLAADLRKAGFTVRPTMTPAMRDAYNAVIDENVGLIRSIGEQHLTQVRTALMQSVQNGRDLGHLSEQLQKRVGVTKRRAALIARDQNAKATAVLQRTRAMEAGITEAIWLHSAGGKTPRPKHVAFSGHKFSLATGHDFDDGNGPTWPGVQINCRCVYKMVVPGLD